MRRRDFIMGIAGSATAWPIAVRARQLEQVRRIGVFTSLASDDAEWQVRNAAFLQGLQELGWSVGRNMRIDIRWGGVGDADRFHKGAVELIALAPEAILATGSATVAALLQVSRSVPIVFVQVADPVGGGYVESLARPAGNATGFTAFEYGISGKWLELLKEIAPRVTRAAVLRDATIAAGAGQFGAMQSIGPAIGVEVRPIGVRDASEIEHAIATFAQGANGGLIVAAGAGTANHRALIINLAARHRLPAVYPYSYYVASGGLLSYGPDNHDQYRRAAGYIDRILKGEKPADLPVQAPTKYDLAINLKAARALGLTVPPTLLARADEVIE